MLGYLLLAIAISNMALNINCENTKQNLDLNDKTVFQTVKILALMGLSVHNSNQVDRKYKLDQIDSAQRQVVYGSLRYYIQAKLQDSNCKSSSCPAIHSCEIQVYKVRHFIRLQSLACR